VENAAKPRRFASKSTVSCSAPRACCVFRLFGCKCAFILNRNSVLQSFVPLKSCRKVPKIGQNASKCLNAPHFASNSTVLFRAPLLHCTVGLFRCKCPLIRYQIPVLQSFVPLKGAEKCRKSGKNGAKCRKTEPLPTTPHFHRAFKSFRCSCAFISYRISVL